MLRLRRSTANRPHRRRRCRLRGPSARSCRWCEVRRLRRPRGEPLGGRHRGDARRSRALPLLRGVGPTLRGSGHQRPHDRLLRADGGRGQAGRRFPLHGAHPQDHRPDNRRRCRCGGGLSARRRGRLLPLALHRRLLLRRFELVAPGGQRPRPERGNRLLRPPRPGIRWRPWAHRPGEGDDRTRSRAHGRSRRLHPGGGGCRPPDRVSGGWPRARGRRLRGRAARMARPIRTYVLTAACYVL